MVLHKKPDDVGRNGGLAYAALSCNSKDFGVMLFYALHASASFTIQSASASTPSPVFAEM